VIDEADPPLLNLGPSKVLEKFETVERAHAELRHLTAFGGMDAVLTRR
jgi:hypothetical protein